MQSLLQPFAKFTALISREELTITTISSIIPTIIEPNFYLEKVYIMTNMSRYDIFCSTQ